MQAETRALTLSVEIALTSPGGFSLEIEFEAPPGITVLFGPSGAGKSTTLSALAGLVRPTAGRIALGQQLWFDAKSGIEKPVHRRKIAYVFQSLALFPHMSALENVEFGIGRDQPAPRRKAIAEAMLVRMRVGHLAARRPPSFSGGEAQRVALARAFAMSPQLILLDEAFTALDRELRRELTQEVRRYVRELEVPAILVTHHRNEARAMGDQVVLVNQGKVTARGSISQLLPKLSDEFEEEDARPFPHEEVSDG